MTIYLDDSKCRENFLPFSLTRHVADLRVGIYTIREKWELILGASCKNFEGEAIDDALVIPANLIPTAKNAEVILQAAKDKVMLLDSQTVQTLHHSWDIFHVNAAAIVDDFFLMKEKSGLRSVDRDTGNDAANLFIHPTALIENCTINATEGPVYIGENALVMDGAILRGPVAICENAVVKMGAKIYGGTTVGPYCVAGGEIKNSMLTAYSNKAHDGYLGDSVIGAWCNIGAGTSNSNVKNTAGHVAYNLDGKGLADSGRMKGGLLMGDYSRCAINISFNTGAVVGVCCNIFGAVNSKKYFPDFSWGEEKYKFPEALNHINAWKEMKGHALTEAEKITLEKIYNDKS